jgi:hypothetical protein
MHVLVVVAALTAGVAPAAAQVNLEFQDGKVRLQAQGVSISQILAEWARRGRTTIVNGERVPGPAVTLELQDVTEQQALDVVLRGVSGYLVANRETMVAGASTFDRIYILPTSSRPTNAAPLPQQPPQQSLQQIQDDLDEDDDPLPPGARGARLPRDIPNGRPIEADEDANQPENRTPPTPTNPFGVAPGTSRPGVITPGAPPTPRSRDQ